jgi:hypothetical protein
VTGLTKLWFRQVGYPAVTDKKVSSKCFGTKNMYHRVNTKYLCVCLNGPFRNDFMLSLSSTSILVNSESAGHVTRYMPAEIFISASRRNGCHFFRQWCRAFSGLFPPMPIWFRHMARMTVTLRQFRRDRYAALVPN